MVKKPLLIVLTTGAFLYLVAIAMSGILSKGYTSSLVSSGADIQAESGMADEANQHADQHGMRVFIGTGNEKTSKQNETRSAIVELNFEPSDTQTQDIETEYDSVALRALKATCSFCGNVIDHLKKYGIPVATFSDITALEKREDYVFRISLQNVCPDCMDAIAYAEDTMYGRMLSIEEMRGLLDSATFSQIKEAACIAGYIPPRSRVAWNYLPACEVGNSVDAKI